MCVCVFSDAALREKVKKIMGSNYFTITPEMVVAPVEAAADAGHFGGSFQVAADSEQKVFTFCVLVDKIRKDAKL